MNLKDKQEIRQIFNEGITQLVLPRFDEIYGEIKEIKKDLKEAKTDIKEMKEDISYLQKDVASIDRKLYAETHWRDKAEKRIKKVETVLEV